MKKKLMWIVFIISTCLVTWYLDSLDPSTPILAAIMGCFCGGVLSLIVPCIYQIKWRYDNGVDLFATLETDPEKVKEHMLFIMQWGHEHGLEGMLKEFNDIFRNYPQWNLQEWEVFRAWYKNEIDCMLLKPEIYQLTMKGSGESYSKEADPLYDPDAPEWSVYDREHYYDDDEGDEDDDVDYYRETCKRSDTADAIAFGIGLGAGLGLGDCNNCGDSSCDCGDGCDCGGSV